ncbi:MAG: Mrp/NBP35 family ATP-binding protein [Candidatus Manganitrophus sp.]|nr:Mrp/NBP35 family ATP-binding protein [Candidatus Manganitrophus sp.]MDC4222770.1 Mrp/NBP35 family ATP-binding protein [Candidatus Manganitrophus sp.]WDT71184.1 MAG: Mrp/NBP35 family ATP-binding protein [Candidatus Manganitrophus sp.]WDT81518.1 MAG: Mrp/NBP35 family ATP-binding protein [Candidatus Manganitrophus sp.]
MSPEAEKDLKTILKKIHFTDDAQVMKQLVDQSLQVKIRMGQIRRKIVIMSGKGGVGKSMTTANISLAFARQGNKVGVLDVDLNGPCIPKMLGVKDRFEFTSEGAIPPVGPYEMKVASMDFFLRQEDSPVRWKGPMELSPVWLGLMEMNVIREFLGDVNWGEIDYLFTDLPPGAAADKPPVIAGFIPELDGAVVVTTPSEVAKTVVKKSIVYARDLGIPIIGLVENMSGALCPNCSTAVPFFEGGCEDLCEELDVPLLGKIPFDRELSHACDSGEPLAAAHPISKRFDEIANRIQQLLDYKKIVAEKL